MAPQAHEPIDSLSNRHVHGQSGLESLDVHELQAFDPDNALQPYERWLNSLVRLDLNLSCSLRVQAERRQVVRPCTPLATSAGRQVGWLAYEQLVRRTLPHGFSVKRDSGFL